LIFFFFLEPDEHLTGEKTRSCLESPGC